jgi:hypothetical protein
MQIMESRLLTTSVIFFSASVDSVGTEEDDSDLRGSVAGSSVGKDGGVGGSGGSAASRMGSRITDLLDRGKAQGHKKPKKNKRQQADKQGK